MLQPTPDGRAKLLHELRSLLENSETDASAQLLTTKQVALLFGVGDRTVRVWAQKNLLPAIRTPGSRWKFPALEIIRNYEAKAK